jgi:threonine aldolase
VGRLAEDNANAARLGQGLTALGLEVIAPESNMVFFTPPGGTEPAAFAAALAKAGVRCSPLAGRIRMVTHSG